MTLYRTINQSFTNFRKKHIFLFCLLCAFLSLSLALVFFYFLKGKYFFFYSVNDDMYLRDMLNGELYVSSGYSIMLKKWLGTFLTALYNWRPYTEWYALLMFGGIIAFLTSCLYALLAASRSLLQVILFPVLYLLLCLCFSEHFLVTTYTEIAA